MSFTPTITTLLGALRRKGYRIYERDGFELNLVGVRTHGRTPGRFDDFVTAFYRSSGEWILNVFPATTDPGAFYLDNPLSSLGTAILREGQYADAYRLGKHKGRYKALVQGAPVTVIRDFDQDGALDFDSGRQETGLFGINIHRASDRNRSIDVGRWSAGCQVLADPRQFAMLMELCEEGRRKWGDKFTYTLLHQRDLEAAEAVERVTPRDVVPLPIDVPPPAPIVA